MTLNSTITPSSAKIKRAQALQTTAYKIEPKTTMNPILIKPSGVTKNQILMISHPYADTTTRSYQNLKPQLRKPVLTALENLHARFNVIICKNTNSPTKINLRANNITNINLTHATNLPILLINNINHNSIFPTLYSTITLLEPNDQALIANYLINKFHSDPTILTPNLTMLHKLTKRTTLNMLPWLNNPFIDTKDSLTITNHPNGTLNIIVIHLHWMNNFTNINALTTKPNVSVHYTHSPTDIKHTNLIILPNTKTTIKNLQQLRNNNLNHTLQTRHNPILNVYNSYQMLNTQIKNTVKNSTGHVEGLKLLPISTVFEHEKLLQRVSATVTLNGHKVPTNNYKIHHKHLSNKKPMIIHNNIIKTN